MKNPEVLRPRDPEISAELEELELASSANFLDNAGYCAAWFCANSKPLVSFFKIESIVLTLSHRIIGTELLNVTTVTTFTAVDGNYFVVRTIFGTLASESKCYHNFAGGRGRCSNFADLPRIF